MKTVSTAALPIETLTVTVQPAACARLAAATVPEARAPKRARPKREAGQRVYGYARVSTREQNEARQMDALSEFGTDRVYVDKQSGKDFNRPQYQALLRKLCPGDVLVVKSIDRLGRNYEEILEQWRIITKDKQAAIVVLDMPLLDTRSNRDLTGTLIADIVLQLLSYVAETERSFIRQRQREGIAAAKARGTRFGPPEKIRPAELGYYVEMWRDGTISARQASQALHVAHTTFLKWAREGTNEAAPRAARGKGRPITAEL